MPTPPLSDDKIREAADALAEYGSVKAAAEALGLARQTLQSRLAIGAKKGYSPAHDWTKTVPDGYRIRGVSTFYTPKGVAGQWVKSSVDPERMAELTREALAAMADEIPRETPRRYKGLSESDLLTLYPLTDLHLGMVAWAPETGDADWDIKKAEDLIVRWFAAAIDGSPRSETAILAQLGDLLHMDGLEAVTPTSRHLLDTDSRFAKIVRTTIRIMRRVIGMLLEKHKFVHIKNLEGNHDISSSIWLREWLAILYENEPRISVDTSPDVYQAYEFGNVLLLFHHGHLKKPSSIDTVFASRYRAEFGRTKYAFAHMGHLHHEDRKRTNLMIVEQHATLAPKDSYAARHGFMSDRSASAITYNKFYGEAGRVIITPAMVLS